MKSIRTLLCAAALALLLSGAAQAKVPPEGRQTLAKAQSLMDDKQYAQAAAVIRKYMQSTQEDVHARVYVLLGGAMHHSGDREQALAVFQKGCQAHPENEYLCLNAGVTLYELKRYAEAGGMFEKTHGLLKAAKPELLFQAGSAYYLGEHFRDAARVLTTLVTQSKAPRKEWSRLAIHALLEAKQFGKAEPMILSYLSASPEDADYWKLLAKLHLGRENYTKAASALEICCRLGSPSRQDLEQLAALYSYQQAPLLAAATLKRAYGTSPTTDQALKMAALFASAGRVEQAVALLDRFSANSAAQVYKGKLLYQARRFKEAETVFQQLLAAQNLPEARFFLALCAWERKSWAQAREELTRIAGLKEFRSQAQNYLDVLKDLELTRAAAE